MTEKERQDNDRWSGSVLLEDDSIIFKSKDVELKRFLLSNIKVIGEMTSQADPLTNDWMFVFVDINNNQYHIPAYANNMDEFLKLVGQRLGSDCWNFVFIN